MNNDLPTIEALVAKRGPFQCHQCQVPIEHPGVCAACGEVRDAVAVAAMFAAARETIPSRFRWASFRAAELHSRVPTGNVAAVLAVKMPLPLGLALVGERGSGKTSLACCMLRRGLDWATAAMVRQAEWDRPTETLAGIERVRRSFFVSAAELIAAAEQGRRFDSVESDVLKRARRAAVLVLDNVEPGDINGIVGRTVLARHDAELPTIITTWMTEGEAGRHYGGGWARRAYEVSVRLEAKGEQARGAA